MLKIIHCLPEIPIFLDVLVFYLMALCGPQTRPPPFVKGLAGEALESLAAAGCPGLTSLRWSHGMPTAGSNPVPRLGQVLS